jgi:hypothetical protein
MTRAILLRAILGGAALLAAGCTPMQWVREDSTPATVEQELADCQRRAWSEARYQAWLYRPWAPVFLHDPFGRRHYGWPHHPFFYDPFADQLMEESRLANFCMRAKGFRLEEVPAKK